MAYSEALSTKTVAISVSDSPDLGALGMGAAHLQDAMAELARHVLALGARVAYGGDLRAGGFTEILFELVSRHRRDADEGDKRTPVVSYLAWPVHILKPYAELRDLRRDLDSFATLELLDNYGESLAAAERAKLDARQPSLEEWSTGLTAMRHRMNAEAHARIIVGGQISGYKGAMPGLAEEALLAIEAGRPLFVLGGFGGCAADIASTMGLCEQPAIPARDWERRGDFAGADTGTLSNGLDETDNRTLARTPHVDEAVALVLKGLLRLEGART